MGLSPLKSDTVSLKISSIRLRGMLIVFSLSLSLYPHRPLPSASLLPRFARFVLRKRCISWGQLGRIYPSGDASGDSISFTVPADNPIARLHGEVRRSIEHDPIGDRNREKQQDAYRNGIITALYTTDATRPLAIIRLGFILFEKFPEIGCVFRARVYPPEIAR